MGMFKEVHRSGRTAVIPLLALATLIAAVGLTVNPWPRDGWYQTQYVLFGRHPGWDDYTPVAAPALLYLAAHQIAARMGLTLAGEFYVASALQNLLALLDACCLYGTLKLVGVSRLAGPLAGAFLLFVLAIGLPQCFYSENAALFLMSLLLLVLARLLYGTDRSRGMFWSSAVLSGVLIGLLVRTRMVPLLLIPAIALLLAHRLPARRVAHFAGALVALTALLLGGAMVANRLRFGRYELTNSAGRHLWQGVKDFSDRALAHSSEYLALKRLDPHVQGKYWDKLPPDVAVPGDAPFQGLVDPREAVLRRLAIEAILSVPGLYLEHGAIKFAKTIGFPPSRDGFAGPGWWNPLRTQRSLPPLADLMRLPRPLGAAVQAVDRGSYAVLARLYPLVVFVIASTCLAVLAERLAARLRRWALGRRLPLVLFVAFGAPLMLMPVATYGMRPGALATLIACAFLLAAGAALLHRALEEPAAALPPRAGISFLCFSALVFFGSLWLTWQIEVQATRYAIPYLPFLVIMLALSGAYWRDLASAVRSRDRGVRAARPALA